MIQTDWDLNNVTMQDLPSTGITDMCYLPYLAQKCNFNWFVGKVRLKKKFIERLWMWFSSRILAFGVFLALDSVPREGIRSSR